MGRADSRSRPPSGAFHSKDPSNLSTTVTLTRTTNVELYNLTDYLPYFGVCFTSPHLIVQNSLYRLHLLLPFYSPRQRR